MDDSPCLVIHILFSYGFTHNSAVNLWNVLLLILLHHQPLPWYPPLVTKFNQIHSDITRTDQMQRKRYYAKKELVSPTTGDLADISRIPILCLCHWVSSFVVSVVHLCNPMTLPSSVTDKDAPKETDQKPQIRNNGHVNMWGTNKSTGGIYFPGLLFLSRPREFLSLSIS